MILAAFASFGVLVLAWLILPLRTNGEAMTVVEATIVDERALVA